MKNITKIFKNEFRTIFVDQGTLLIMFIAIFLYAFVYPIAFLTQVLKDVPIGVVDMDNSKLSRELIRDIDSNELVKVASEPVDVDEAKQEFSSNAIRSYIVIPPNFEKNIKQGRQSNIGAFVDGSYVVIYKQVLSGISASVNALSAKLEIGKLAKSGINKNTAIRIKKPFEFVQMPLYNPAGGYENYVFPLVLVLLLQQTMVVGISMLGGTRKEHKKRANSLGDMRYKYCKYSDNPVEIVLGRSLAYVALYFCHAMFYFLFLPALFGLNMSYHLGALLLLVIPYLFAISFMGQAIIFFCVERESSLQVIILFSLPMVFLPGLIWPKEAIPMWLRFLSCFLPSTSGIEGLVKVNQVGANILQVQNDFWLLICLCILYFYLACKVTKKLVK